MKNKPKLNRGGQPGNRNALKHGFYSKALSPERKLDFRRAKNIRGIDEEIALLRLEIKSLVEQDSSDSRLIAQHIKILASLENARFDIREKNGDSVVDALRNFYETNEIFRSFRESFKRPASSNPDTPVNGEAKSSPQAGGHRGVQSAYALTVSPLSQPDDSAKRNEPVSIAEPDSSGTFE